MKTVLLIKLIMIIVFLPLVNSIEIDTNQRDPASCMDVIELSSYSGESIEPPPKPNSDDSLIISSIKLNELLPSQISKEEDGYVLLEKIADKGLQKIVSSDQFKSTPLGTLNETVKEKTKVELNIVENHSIEHKIGAQLEPFRGGGTVTYHGYFGATYTFYDLNKGKKLRLEEKFLGKDLFFETIVNEEERVDQIGVAWGW